MSYETVHAKRTSRRVVSVSEFRALLLAFMRNFRGGSGNRLWKFFLPLSTISFSLSLLLVPSQSPDAEAQKVPDLKDVARG